MMDDDDEVPTLIEIPKADKIIPVTLLTGYLGAGKTTLLNHILQSNHGKKIAVVENEFSAGMGIEAMIAKSGVDGTAMEMAGFFELNNGCICCTVKDNLVLTLEQLIFHKDKFDYILIEATGIANPGPIITSLWTDEDTDSPLRLDGVVTVVDFQNILLSLQDPVSSNDVRLQIAYADRILLNKSDLITPDKISEIEALIRGINSIAGMQRTSYSKIDLDWVLDIKSFSLANAMTVFSSSMGGSMTNATFCFPCADSNDGASGSSGGFSIGSEAVVNLLPLAEKTNIHSASQELGSFSMSFDGCFHLNLLKGFLDNLLYLSETKPMQNYTERELTETESFARVTSHQPPFTSHQPPFGSNNIVEATEQPRNSSIYRMKGIFHIEGFDRLYILQAVYDMFDIQPSSFLIGSQTDVTNGKSYVVVIGRNVDANLLKEGFSKCIYEV